MNIYYRGLDLELDTGDWRFLNYLYYTYTSKTKPYTTPRGTFDQYRDFFLRDSSNDYREQPIFTKIAQLFGSGLHCSVDHVYKYSQVSVVGGTLVPHIDTRTCVVSIPMLPLSSVIWYKNLTESSEKILWNPQEYMEIETYDYRYTASLVNTSIYHGVPNNDKARIFFQVGGFNDAFIEVVKSLKRGDIQ
jgi:hypothetical protein